jgi:hypothetical protein
MKNLKLKEWWQIVQKFTKEQIQENMELAHFNEHNYQLELQAYESLSLTLNTNPLVSYLWKL